MPRRRELSSQLRSRICELHSIGISYSKIHLIHPEIPLGTIKSTCQRESSRLNNESRPRSGHPRIISEEQRDQIYDIVTHVNPNVKYSELAYDVLGDASKKRAVKALCKEMKLRK